MALSDIITAVSSVLTHVAPTSTNIRHLAQNDTTAVPPRFVWDRLAISQVWSRGEAGGKVPRSRHAEGHTSVVHCWGATEDDCEAMRAALFRAMRSLSELSGDGQQPVPYEPGDADWTYPEWAPSGFVLSQRVTVFAPLVDVVVPEEAGSGIPSQDVVRDYGTRRQVIAVGFDADNAIDGDRVLEADETPQPPTQGFDSGFSSGFGKP